MRSFIALLFLVSAISAETLENYKRIVRPEAQVCKEQLGATDVCKVMHGELQKTLYNEKAKCLSACVLERIGVMKNGSWTAVPAEHRLEVYNEVFAGDTNRLEFADRVINDCHEQADQKYRAVGYGCEAAYHAITCLWDLTY
ncbi:CLUMA_CG010580, isoform A [Gryllus bimaculatus]|nr:CLUMA_CG010580, isoform A [Gryllus bimaculatus]